jgi:hypothetical protein
MTSTIYVTGNLFCGECGNFLTPELLRNEKGGVTGEVIVTRHADWCSLFGKRVKVRLPSVEASQVMST